MSYNVTFNNFIDCFQTKKKRKNNKSTIIISYFVVVVVAISLYLPYSSGIRGVIRSVHSVQTIMW